MELDLAFFLAAVPAVLVAGLSKGGFGSGAAFASTPFLALVLPPDLAVGLMLPLLMVMDATGLRAWWRRWDWAASRPLMVAALPGIALGALLFGLADPDLVRVALGGIAILFVAWTVARPWLPVAGLGRRGGIAGAGLAGLATGFTSFVAHAGGPPAAIWLLSRNLSKEAYQASSVLVFGWVNLAKLPPFLGLGLITADTLLAGLLLVPVAILGTLLGVWAHRHVPERPFFLLIHALLVVTGAKLVWDGLT